MFKKILIALVIVLPVLALGFALFGDRGETLVRQQPVSKPVYPSRTPANVPQTKLRFIPKEIHLRPDGNVETEVFLDASENRVTEITIEIAYDPKVFRVLEVEPVDYLAYKKVTINEIDRKNGKITFGAIVDTAKEPPISGSDAALELVLKPIDNAAVASQLKFLPGTTVTAEGITGNALVATEDTLVRLIKE